MPQLVLVVCGAGGGAPWHVPHAACEAPPVQLGAWFVPPAARVAPWQYVLEQVVPFQAGAAPFARARVPNVTPTAPFQWSTAVGTTWHSAQAVGEARAPVPLFR